MTGSNVPPDGDDAIMGPHDMRNRYDGYLPVAGHDLAFAEDVEQGKMFSEVDKTMLRDVAHTSWLNVVILGMFAALFVSFTVWSGLVGACKVNHFCEVFDHSSISKAFPRAAAMRVPTVYLWGGLAVASFSLSVSAFYAVKLMRKPVGTARMSEIATHIYECAHSLLSYQLKGYTLPVIIVFVLVGFAVGWTFSGGLLFGAMISKIVATAAVSIATRANLRTTAAARQGFYPAARTAFRAGSSLALAITALGLLGNCAIYLMLEDVRILIAFAAGASSVAFVCRVIGSVYTSATSLGSRLLNALHMQSDSRMKEHLPLRFLHTGGDYLGDISGIGIDLLETFCSAISVCAILGAMLPYYPRDPFAVCVFNHLDVDLMCGSFGYPQFLSYAIYICRAGNMYQSYPVLSVWQSNTTFIAIPYLVAAAGIVASLVCTIRMYTPKDEDDMPPNHVHRMSRILWGFRGNVLLAALLVVSGCAAVMYGLLGPNSDFQQAKGFGRDKNLQRFVLDSGNVSQVCRAQFEDSIKYTTAFPIPHGAFVSSRYKPVSVLGFHFGAANTTAHRLFVCALIGVVLGLLLEYSTEFFTSATSTPVRRVAESAEYGPELMFVQGLGTGMLSSAGPLILVCFSILGSYHIYGQYGVALSSVGLLTLLGVVTTVDSFSSISSSSGQMAKLSNLGSSVQDVTAALESTGRTGTALSKLFSNASAMITTVALHSAYVTIAGLAPHARDLVGTTEKPGTMLIGNVNPVSMLDFRVRLCMMLGCMIPFLFAGLVIGSGRKAANAMVVGTRRHIRRVEEVVRDGGFAKARLSHCFSLARRSSLLETILPTVIAFATPMIIGFGFGSKSLVGFSITTAASIFVVGTVFGDAGEIWSNAMKLIELGELGHKHGRDSKWHETATICDGVGRALKETAGGAISILMKLIPYLGYLGVTLMLPEGGERKWIGGVIFVVLIVFSVLLTGLKRRWDVKIMEEAREHWMDDRVELPARRISPFYESGTMVGMNDAAVGSQLEGALDVVATEAAAGLRVEASELPGLREDVVMEDVELVVIGESANEGEDYVVADTARG